MSSDPMERSPSSSLPAFAAKLLYQSAWLSWPTEPSRFTHISVASGAKAARRLATSLNLSPCRYCSTTVRTRGSSTSELLPAGVGGEEGGGGGVEARAELQRASSTRRRFSMSVRRVRRGGGSRAPLAVTGDGRR